METNKKNLTHILLLIVAAAFFLRLAAGTILFSGYLPFLGGCYQKGFWGCGYVEYADIAISFAEGKGFYRVDAILGEKWSLRPPLYPLILAGLYTTFGKSSMPPILIQSLFGALTVLFTYLIAKEIFNEKVGILASVLAALYPYNVFHDTSLQENALFTLLTAVTVFFFLKSSKSISLVHSFLTGVFLSFAVLVKVTLLTLIPFAILWFMIVLKNNRAKMILVMLAGFIIVSSPWVIRNAIIHGKPLFVIHSGTTLWSGQNPYTLAGYPYKHIDRMTEKAWAAISDKEKEEYKRLSEMERDDWFKQKAIKFMKENPLIVLKGAFLKVYAVMGWNLSPNEGNWVKNLFYTISYLPLLLFGIIGAFFARDKWRELFLIYSLFFTFIGTSAIFIGHTSHRTYLDIYLMILSSYTIITKYDDVGRYLYE